MKPFYDPGLYKCRITNQGFNEASTGTAQFWLKFDVLEQIEPFSDILEKFSRTIYFPITARTADRVMHDLHSLGFKGDSFDGVDPREDGYHSFVGKEIELTCSHEDDRNHQPRERWALRGVGMGRPLANDKVRMLNRLLSEESKIAKEIEDAER